MSDHYVRHMLRCGDSVQTTFECRAPAGAPCREMCRTCDGEDREICECESLERTPTMVPVDCMIVTWLENDAPEECYNGDGEPVRGPDWQAIVPEWNGDNFDWDYAA